MPKPPRIPKVTRGGQQSIPAEPPRQRGRDERRQPEHEPQGAVRMLGFARRFRVTRFTADWMAELRGEAKS